MRYYGKKILAIIAVLVCLVSLVSGTVMAAENETTVEVEATPTPTPIPIETNHISGWPQGPQISATTACLMDANTGTILYDKQMTKKMYPASTTKIMTALIALEHASLDETVTFTETGVAEAYSGSSNLFTQVGEQFTMKDCLYALLLKSANDFASQIAEHVGGSVENFTQMMNDKAAELGCVNTHFNNAHGLPDENHYTCAYDLALIMRAVSQYDFYCEVSGTEVYTIPATPLTGARTFDNHNALIKKDHVRYYEGVLAGKTGYTDAARNTFVSIAERNGMRLIEVTMQSPVSDESFINAHILYEYGFQNFQNIQMQSNTDAYLCSMVTVPTGITSDMIQIEQGNAYDTSAGIFADEQYAFNGHVVGASIVSSDYIAQLEAADAESRAQKEADADAAEQMAREKQGKNREALFQAGLQSVYQLIILVLVILVLLGVMLIIVSLARKGKKKKR